MKNYFRQVFQDVTLPFDDPTPSEGRLDINSGTHSIFNSLTIKDKGVLNIVDKPEWWTKKNKWVILEIKHDLILSGEIRVLDWRFPRLPLVDVSESIEYDADDFKPGYAFKPDRIYEFSIGGHGGYGADGILPNPAEIKGGQGAPGTIFYGGGGGGGVGIIQVPGQKVNTPGSNAVGNVAGPAGTGTFSYNGMLCSGQGGNGGGGGLTPDHGVGGLLIIICHGELKWLGGTIQAFGRWGNDGLQGENSTHIQPPGGLIYLLNGAGGGGAGSPGLPGGTVYCCSKKISGKENIVVTGGAPGGGKPKGKTILLGTYAGDGSDGIPGQDGKKKNMKYPF